MNQYFMTEDGMIFDDLDKAANHDSVLQFNLYGEFGHYGRILEGDQYGPFKYVDRTPKCFYRR